MLVFSIKYKIDQEGKYLDPISSLKRKVLRNSFF